MTGNISESYIEEGLWDFVGEDTKKFTHCFHIYPAMMIPQIAEGLIDNYGIQNGMLFDPYCGTGTSLVEGKRASMNCIGTDLNPLAQMISRAKTNHYNINELRDLIDSFTENLEAELRSMDDFMEFDDPELVNFDRLKDWFSEKVIAELMFIRKRIADYEFSPEHLDFFKVSFSECLRKVSFQRNGEFKLYRIPLEMRTDDYAQGVLGALLISNLERNYTGVVELNEDIDDDSNHTTEVYGFNTVSSNGSSDIQQTVPWVDLVVTSPPYGDSGTTVAYAQFSWLSNVILDMEGRPPGAIDRDLMGGRRSDVSHFGCEELDACIDAISQIDGKRAKEVMNFYDEFNRSIVTVAGLVKPGGFVAYVVGNRTVKGIQLPTDKFTQWAFEQQGFKSEPTRIRKIPNKRMPSKNSPTNVTGKTSSTMSNEYIIVCQKI